MDFCSKARVIWDHQSRRNKKNGDCEWVQWCVGNDCPSNAHRILHDWSV